MLKALHQARARTPDEKYHQYALAAMLSIGAVALVFLWEGRTGFSLWDEGFLWYGAQRVMAGEVPIRDFISYDPGRYYWSAALMTVGGSNGIMALRVSLAICQVLGLLVGLIVLLRSTEKQDRLFWLVSAVTLVLWMFPRHKLYDSSLSIALVAGLSLLVERPTRWRYFLAGALVGIAAVFGRNHGVYGAVGSLGVVAFLRIKPAEGPRLLSDIGAWSLGVLAGYLPCLLQIAVVPGFAPALWADVHRMIELKSTNLPLPVPWPWRVPIGQLGAMEAARGVAEGVFFVLIAVYGLLSVVWVIRQRLKREKVPPVLAASAFLAVPYAHFSYSRADASHLAQGMFPFLLGILALLAARPVRVKWSIGMLLCGASLMIALPQHPGWQCHARQCVTADVAGSKLTFDPATARDIAMLNRLAEQFAPGNRSFIAVPFWPGAYAVLGRKAPIWEVYPLWPASPMLQQAEIERLNDANPGFAVILDEPLDGREELRYSNTHPMIDRYIRGHFERLTGYSDNPACHVYRSRLQPV